MPFEVREPEGAKRARSDERPFRGDGSSAICDQPQAARERLEKREIVRLRIPTTVISRV
jgi:hypothetical protein